MSFIRRCQKCHHEWVCISEIADEHSCDWCGSPGQAIETPSTTTEDVMYIMGDWVRENLSRPDED